GRSRHPGCARGHRRGGQASASVMTPAAVRIRGVRGTRRVVDTRPGISFLARAVRTRARATPGGARPAREGYGGCAPARRPRSGRPAFSTLGYRVRARGGLAESAGRPTGRARGGRLPGHVDEHVDVLPLETCTRCGGAVGTEQ